MAIVTFSAFVSAASIRSELLILVRDASTGREVSPLWAWAVGRLFGVSETVAIKWIARWRRTGSVAAKRERWRQRQGGFDPGRLVFIDETWAFASLRLARDLLSAKLLT